jgi:hypothetical protein
VRQPRNQAPDGAEKINLAKPERQKSPGNSRASAPGRLIIFRAAKIGV